MEIQLSELIEQIKKEGVEAAESESATIVDDAKAEAEKIIAEAEKKASEILEKAKADNERLVKAGEDAIRQAGRNLLISFRESVNKELDVIIGEKVSKVFSSEELIKIIAEVVKATAANNEGDISVLLNAKDLEAFQRDILAALKERMLSGVTLVPNDNFRGGFRVEVNEGTAYYDYSAAAVTEMLSAYLNPKVTALLKEAESK